MTTNDDNTKSINTSGDYVDTGGGDYAQGNIDKRQGGAFVEGNVYGNVIAVNQGTINIAPTMTAQERRNRSRMLQKVRDFWVKGVLERSLYNEVLIELGLETRPDAVMHPWDMVIQEPDREARPLPSGTKIVNVFDDFGGELLILGAPGSGKTTMLLELARDLITRAEQDENLPIPVVFNLSSWAEKRAPLVEWLVDELNVRYDVPRQVGKTWIGTDTVLPLLDGLDEVKQDQRTACVEAINTFRQENGLVSVVVCSRVADYDALTKRLKLQGAVLVQPLNVQQVDAYLASTSDKLAVLRAALTQDASLRELAETPLMLSIMILAYHNASADILTMTGTIEARRRHLLKIYVERMFVWRGTSKTYRSARSLRWLVWLARSMMYQNMTQLHVERMQAAWLSNRVQRWLYFSCTGLFVGMLLGSSVGLAFGLFVDLGITLMGSASPGFTASLNYLLLGIPAGAVIGAIAGLRSLLLGRDRTIDVAETLQWSWSKTKEELQWWAAWWVLPGLFLLLGNGLNTFAKLLAAVLGLGFAQGMTGAEVETRMTPNQGTWRSARNGMLVGLGVGQVICLAVIILSTQATNARLVTGAALGLIFGTFMGLRLGGFAFIQHFALRFVLFLSGSLPWRYVHFLNYCADHVFLRKVGGGYIFVHRLLIEHFASLQDKPTATDETVETATVTP